MKLTVPSKVPYRWKSYASSRIRAGIPTRTWAISALGIVRELVPGVALEALTPAALGDTARQGAPVPMSVAAIAVVLVTWVVVSLVAGGVRDTTRDA